VLQIANVSSGAGSLAGKVKFVEDAETRKNLPYATQAMAYKMSKVSTVLLAAYALTGYFPPYLCCWCG
jgi:hypothetical protein